MANLLEQQLRLKNEAVIKYQNALGLKTPLPLPQLAALASLAADLELDIAMRLAAQGDLKGAMVNLGGAITLTRNAAFHLSNYTPPTRATPTAQPLWEPVCEGCGAAGELLDGRCGDCHKNEQQKNE